METRTKTDLYALYKFFRDAGDLRRAKQMKRLIQKKAENHLVIGFSGHFSAGKSSLINALMDDRFLPTSPIPTSANVVRLAYGEPKIVLTRHDETRTVFLPPYDVRAIWENCKNGQDVLEVFIQTDQGMPEDLEWMDTPGIDSTDPLHMEMTEDAIILADHIFYVADYNHVLAEENYRFLMTLEEMNKPYHLVISQIDKHRENELSFEAYKKSIFDSLSAWKLKPESIHFISIKDLSLAVNEWEAFRFYLKTLSDKRSAQPETEAVLRKLYKDHIKWWKNQYGDAEKAMAEAFDGIDREHLTYRRDVLKTKLETLHARKRQWLDDCIKAGDQAIDNAILMPYETRELARQYIEACQPDFKMGFFSTKAKVEKERMNRLDALLQNLNQLLLTMNRQTAESLFNPLKKYLSMDEAVRTRLYSLNVEASPELIENHVEKGALLTGQYVLTYTAALESTLKKQMKKEVRNLLEELTPLINQPIHQAKEAVENEMKDLDEQLKQFDAYADALKKENTHFQTGEEILEGTIILNEEERHLVEEDFLAQEEMIASMRMEEKPMAEKSPTIEETPSEMPTPEIQEAPEDWEARFRKAEQILRGINGFTYLAERFSKRADRLKNQRYTVALFGAFSAGKSSFANAMLGQKVLPVSPHPTTATINRILPVDCDHAHGSVAIHFKTEKAILDEVNQALETFQQRVDALEELPTVIENALLQATESRHMVFLKAVAKGYRDAQGSLGRTHTLPLAEALPFISVEQKACFVDMADIYFDCPLTQSGVSLVDTPGADSINARHTDTAFRYIRNADALVYITYYNHAFSRADEEFLLQLGRVKEAFELDKMFFVVNAIDLAQSADEAQEVVRYVRERLYTYGIRQARLYGISSLKALESGENASSASGFDKFYNDWDEFVRFGLQKQTIEQGVRDFGHAKRVLEETMKRIALSATEREQVLERMAEGYRYATSVIQAMDAKGALSRLQNEVRELFFYVKKRVIQRFLDEFSRFFNPAILSSTEKEPKKVLLSRSLEECLQFLSFDLDQEIRATYLRTEAMLSKLIAEYREDALAQLGEEWAVEWPEKPEWKTPEITASLKQTDRLPFEACFKHFKNPKQFFEADGKSRMREAMQLVLSKAIDHVLSQNTEETLQHYEIIFKNTLEKDRAHALNDLETLRREQEQSLTFDAEAFQKIRDAQESINQLMPIQ